MVEQGEHFGDETYYSVCILWGVVVESLFLLCAFLALCRETDLGFQLAHFQAVEKRKAGKVGKLQCTS